MTLCVMGTSRPTGICRHPADLYSSLSPLDRRLDDPKPGIELCITSAGISSLLNRHTAALSLWERCQNSSTSEEDSSRLSMIDS
jgi:hypothetical protein